MSLLSFGFLLLIVLVSGGIAVLADWLGRKVGKKKLTVKTRWFRLRPKTTAQVFTFLSGVAVSFFTILIVSLASSDVREWIAEGPAAVEMLAKTRLEVRQLSDQRDGLRSEITSRSRQLSDLQRTGNRLRAEITKLRTQTVDLQTQLVGYRSRLDEARSRYDRIDRQYRAVQSRMTGLQTMLDGAKREVKLASLNLKTTEKQLHDAKTNLKATQSSLREAKEGRDTAVAQYNEMTQQELKLEQEVSGLEADTKRLREERYRAQNDLDFTQQQLSLAYENLAKAQVTLDQLKDDYNEQQNMLRSAGTVMLRSRSQPLMFQIGDELARTSVPPNATVDDALQIIRTLIRSAQKQAIDKGAEANGMVPAAGIFERRDPETKRVFTPDELMGQLAEQLANNNESQLLVAISTLNAFKGEPVSLEIAVAGNPVVYRASSVVVESRIDGHKDDADILNQITNFVSNTVKDQARRDHMVGKRGGDSEFGSIPMSTVYSLVGRVKAMGRTVRIQAIADVDTRAGDPLKLDFRLK